MSLLLFWIALVFLAQALGNQTPDAGSQDPIGNQIVLHQSLVPGCFGRGEALAV
jgi:hypothetical protein